MGRVKGNNPPCARSIFPAITHLDDLVPASRDDDRVGRVGAESHTGDPLGVAVLLDVELALSEGVPELDGAVSGSGDDLSVVSGEADGQNIRVVADESSSGGSGVEVPESKGLVPGRAQGELTVGGDDDIRDEVGVTLEDLLWVTVAALVAGELPDDERLVTGSGDEGVGCL